MVSQPRGSPGNHPVHSMPVPLGRLQRPENEFVLWQLSLQGPRPLRLSMAQIAPNGAVRRHLPHGERDEFAILLQQRALSGSIGVNRSLPNGGR